MLKKEARQITGGLSKPSKMPGPAHNLPAVACKTGQAGEGPGLSLRWLLCSEGPLSVHQRAASIAAKAASVRGPALGGCDGNTDQGPGLVQVA